MRSMDSYEKIESRLAEAEKKINLINNIGFVVLTVAAIFGAGAGFGYNVIISASEKIEKLSSDLSSLQNKINEARKQIETNPASAAVKPKTEIRHEKFITTKELRIVSETGRVIAIIGESESGAGLFSIYGNNGNTLALTPSSINISQSNKSIFEITSDSDGAIIIARNKMMKNATIIGSSIYGDGYIELVSNNPEHSKVVLSPSTGLSSEN